MGPRGQVAVEFFLVASFLLALSAAVLVTAESSLRDVESLNSAASCKAAADAVAESVNLVYLSGNYSSVRGEVFVPKQAICFLVNESGPYIQCEPDPSIQGRVSSVPLRTPSVSFNDSCPPQSQARGWFGILVANNNGTVTVNCTQLG